MTFDEETLKTFKTLLVQQQAIIEANVEANLEQKRKRRRVLEEYNREKGPRTRSEWIQTLPADEYVVNKNLLSHFKRPTNAQIKKMELPGNILDNIMNLKKEPRDGSEGSRALFSRLVEAWDAIDTSNGNSPTIGLHKPDLLHRKAGRGGEQSVRAPGEIKGMDDGDFTCEQTGQICDFLLTCLTIQPWRTFVYGYLTDCKRFEFFKATKGVKENNAIIFFERTGVLVGELGWSTLRTFTCQDDVTLGYEDVSILGWTLQSWLGTGLTSVAFYAEDKKSPKIHAVCKVYLSKADGANLRERERVALDKLSVFQCIPRVVEGAPTNSACGRSVLITTPRGLDIPIEIQPPVSAYAPIVLALAHAHANDIYHNDIAPQNIFGVFTTSGDVMIILNDFGSATGMAQITSNASIPSRPMYYDTSAEVRFGAKADLLALVRSIFVLSQSTFNLGDMDTPAVQLDIVMCSQLVFWEQALLMASTLKYNNLHAHLLNGGR